METKLEPSNFENNKISIIVPVYNVELYLAECLDSIINQSHQNLEIILVNDGSTDQSAKICDFYVAKDHRITVIHKENEGPSSARNEGMNRISGNYVSFVDSDDLIDKQFCENLLKILFDHDADIVECRFLRFRESSEINSIKPASRSINIYLTEEALEAQFKKELENTACNKLFKTEIIKDLKFEEGKINEDDFWAYLAIDRAKKIVKTNQQLYFYRQHNKSIMGRKFNIGRLDGVESAERKLDFMAKNYPNLINIASRNLFFLGLYIYQKITFNPEIDPKKIHRKEIINRIKKIKKNNFHSDWEFKKRLWLDFFLLLPDTCTKISQKFKMGAD